MGFASLFLTRFGPARATIALWRPDAANEAGMSRRYGGIRYARAGFGRARLDGTVADKVWFKSRALFIGKFPKGTASLKSSEKSNPGEVN